MSKKYLGRCVSACALAGIVILASAGISRASSFYMEVPKDGRIYVFNMMDAYEAWKTSGEMGKSITRIGAGPDGETIVFDSVEAIHMYNFKHGLPGEVIEEPSVESKEPAVSVGWKDGKTTIETKNSKLQISNRVQVRFTNEMPDDGESMGSFRIRRGKTKFEGWVYREELSYKLQLNWADPENELEDAYLSYDLFRGNDLLHVQGGQFKVPFGRQELTSSGSQQFVDRSIVSGEFAKGRDIGFEAGGKLPGGVLEYAAGAFNGAGRNKSENDNDHLQYDGRVTWQPLGDVKFSESDFESKNKPLVAVAVQYESNDQRGATMGDDIFRKVFGGDVVFKFKGVSVFGEYYLKHNEPESAPNFDTEGFAAQVGYFVYHRILEVAARLASLDPSDEVSDDRRTEKGLAVNWFMNKHNLKLQADYRKLEDDATDTTDGEFRLQMQFIF